MTAKDLIEQLSKVAPETEIVGGMWNGRTNTYTVLDELHVFGFDDIYNDFYGTPGAFDDKLMTIKSKDVVYLGSLFDSCNEHADTPLGYFSASWDGEAVTVCIADGGKTIFGSYLDRQFEGIGSDQAALHAAVSGVSTKNRPGAENRGFGISTSADMVIRGLNSAMVILSGRGLLIRNRERNDFTELPEPVYMPGTLVCFTMPVQKDGFTIYEYIGG